ncbi:MAG: aminotransferase class IV family protein [Candidatus Omnitrophica bacterium]|nr:aminotransferase class IV family protein [Candidatus Omnitrophota bacterium]
MTDPFDASGCFETCRVERGRALRLEEHLHRLASSMKTLGMTGWDGEVARVEAVAAAWTVRDGYLRLAVMRGGRLGLAAGGGLRLLVHRHAGRPYPAAWERSGIAVRTVPSRWPAGETAVAQAKMSERLAGVLAQAEAPDSAEVLRIGRHGYLTEGTVSNLFLVREGRLTTPPAWLGVLEGVTRARVLGEARRLRIPIEEVPVTRHDLFNAQEAFLTNVLMPILPIREADGRRIGVSAPGPVTWKLAKALR